jgi:hypothetical protein
MTPDKYTNHLDLTDDVGATVKVYGWSSDRVHLGAGGDLSISIGMSAAAAIALGESLIAAANIAKEIA